VLIHSDQGSQFTSMDWAAFVRAHNLEHSMSRRGNCHDNAVAESFFSSLKRERIRRRTYKTREEARQDVFDPIEMFYNPVRKHVRNEMLSPVEFERQQMLKAEGVQKSRGYSQDQEWIDHSLLAGVHPPRDGHVGAATQCTVSSAGDVIGFTQAMPDNRAFHSFSECRVPAFEVATKASTASSTRPSRRQFKTVR